MIANGDTDEDKEKDDVQPEESEETAEDKIEDKISEDEEPKEATIDEGTEEPVIETLTGKKCPKCGGTNHPVGLNGVVIVEQH